MRWAASLLVVVLFWGGAAWTPPVAAQPDSVRARILERKGFDPDHSPRGALWRAAVLPGWGQIYNHDYLKVPLVWGGLAGMGALVYWTNDQYRLFRRAALFRLGQEQMSGDGDTNPWAQYEGAFDEVAQTYGSNVSSRQLRNQRDSYRSRRDLSIVGTGLFYALTLLDAYVSAHLLTFNVGEDLAVRAVPTGRLPPPSVNAPSANAPSANAPTHAEASSVALSLPASDRFDRAASIGPGVSVRITF